MNYDPSKAVYDDIKTHTVHYIAVSEQYGTTGIGPTTGSFTFEVTCLDNVSSSTVETAVQNETFIIGADATPLTLTEPVVSFPRACFTVSTYEVVDVTSGLTPPWITIYGTEVEIFSKETDLIALSPFTLRITTRLSNDDLIGQHEFNVSF